MTLAELVEELNDLDDAEKLEWLVEYSDELPPLSPGRTAGPAAESCRVQECQTPVYLWIEVDRDRVRIEADVPKRSPTVRGLVAAVVQCLNDANSAQVAGLPEDLIAHLGLQKALGMQRQQGFRGVVARIKREVRRQAVP